MNITLFLISVAAVAALCVALISRKRRSTKALQQQSKNIEEFLQGQTQRIIDTVQQCANYLRIPPERVLDLMEPIEIEAPLPPGLGRYIPTDAMITYHLQSAVRSLCEARAAFLDNNDPLARESIVSMEQSLHYALRGKELRDAEATALAETQKALQAAQK